MTSADPGRAAIYNMVDYGIQIELFTIEFIEDAGQVFWFHELKLVANRRDNSLVSFTRLFHKITITQYRAARSNN